MRNTASKRGVRKTIRSGKQTHHGPSFSRHGENHPPNSASSLPARPHLLSRRIRGADPRSLPPNGPGLDGGLDALLPPRGRNLRRLPEQLRTRQGAGPPPTADDRKGYAGERLPSYSSCGIIYHLRPTGRRAAMGCSKQNRPQHVPRSRHAFFLAKTRESNVSSSRLSQTEPCPQGAIHPKPCQ